MNESEFRDWARAQLSAFDERIKRVEARPVGEAKPQVNQRIHGSILKLTEELLTRVKERRVLGVGILFVDDEMKTMTGWSADGGYFALAGAATFMGLEILEEFRKSETAIAANDDEEKAA
jgi:hypothetical protein